MTGRNVSARLGLTDKDFYLKKKKKDRCSPEVPMFSQQCQACFALHFTCKCRGGEGKERKGKGRGGEGR